MNVAKRLVAIALAALLVCAPALAERPEFDGMLFENAKDAIWLIATGDYELALKMLDFKESAPSGDDFKDFITSSFPSFKNDGVQYEVAVAYYKDNIWTLAIPILEPVDETVETFALFSSDGKRFDGCGKLVWGDVESMCDKTYDVIWNIEYCPSNTLVVIDSAD